MKYSIYDFNQQKCIDNDLDITDILILSYVKNFYPKMNKIVEDNKEYVWFNYSSFIKEYPILKIEKTITISTRLLKLQKKGIITKKCIRNETGTFSYVSLTEKYFELLTNTTYSENKTPFDENKTPFDENKRGGFYKNKRQKDPLTISNPLTISKKEKEKEKIKMDLSFIDNKDFLDLVNKWLSYRIEIKKPYKSNESVKQFYYKLIKLSNNDIDTATEIINNSIANEYQGIFALKTNNFTNNFERVY